MSFPKDFVWGAASAAYQVEGAYLEDGKGLGIWDALSDGHILHNDTGNVACDHYHRYKEDIAIMKKMGLKAYRFSVSWPRIQPEEGKVNEKGVAFYKDLVQELVNAGIRPMCTLFHWNLPMWLHEKGGWRNPDIGVYFAEFTKIVVDALSDKVSDWMTVNEPLCFIGLGYLTGRHAPFEEAADQAAFAAELPPLTRNMLVAHGMAVKTIRERAVLPPVIGMALNAGINLPWDDTDEEIEEARRRTFPEDAGLGSLNWWADPMILGTAPEALAAAISPSDWKTIHQPLDFIGYNCYYASVENDSREDGRVNPYVYTGQPRTAMGWPVTPDALYWAARFITQRYRLPLLITENGMANMDFVMGDGKVHDPQRIAYLEGYLRGLKRAVEEGCPVMGYLYWSILDNFEWTEGYDRRFGLVYVDYRTQKRTMKDSAFWYADVIAENGENL